MKLIVDEAYWKQLVDVKIAEQYFLQYVYHSKRRLVAINAFCLLMSCAGIVAWVTSNIPPLPSSLIILLAQIISILQPFYPYSDRLYAATCIYTEYSQQALMAEQTMNRFLFGNITAEELPAMLEKLQADVSIIEGKFSSPGLFPQSTRLHNAAQKNAMQYLQFHFDLGG